MNPNVPARAELVRRAAEVAPVLRSHAPWGEEHRRLHEESLAALTDAGLFRMRVPTRYGGYETEAATFVEVMTELAQGDGSAAWNVSAWSISAWMACQFPDHVQDEVFASDVRVCGVLSPSASAVPAADGAVVNGRWQFISGAHHSQWQVALAMGPTPDGSSQWPLMALIPLSDLTIVDDWDTTGLRGTGSVTTVAENVFVPHDRLLPLALVLQEQSASKLNPESPLYRAPLIATGSTTFTGTAIGLAKSALAVFLEQLDKKITYTEYASRREAPITHLQVAEAALRIEEAEAHAARLAAMVDAKGAAGEPWTVEERARSRAYLGRVFQLATRTARTLGDASGGGSLYLTGTLQRTVRDLHALSLHALMHSSTNTELYGRVLCGLPPNTMYL
ncbi:acyl-CoA dehydrogenase [Streptomyces kaniharaensis]|uniref:Acyl-CoA dehydrogenase n=1 Tax=Streptomyces kaniharaensis TaxID=212423 RepID=A0A6N7KH05_9ACTN|nr:acyl-CoA dehydrogenase family protein [Streptomyces kaniharaensis]MQS10722.1 acyl-CoA dehydrogenase [Streptomyces kaniharaensis]